jgi:anti-anti-sigma factor
MRVRQTAGAVAASAGGEVQIDLQETPDRVTVVAPKGPLDVSSADALRQRMRELVESGVLQVVVDLDAVTFLDSSGLGAIIGGLKRFRQGGGDLRIAHPNQQVRMLLELTSLDKVLQPYGPLVSPTVPAAPPGVAVSCRATAEQLHVVYDALAEFWRRLDRPPPDEWRMLFELAVSEIAANIVEHARPPRMQLRLSKEGDRVIAEFTDTGNGWAGPPDSSPGLAALLEPADDSSLDQLPERGRGLPIVVKAVDDMVYERSGRTNRWLLIKSF